MADEMHTIHRRDALKLLATAPAVMHAGVRGGGNIADFPR
jgi:hypothetical protein